MTTGLVRTSSRALLTGATLLLLVSSRAAENTPNPGEVVQLEAFKVNTKIDSYAETTTSTAGKLPLTLEEIAGTIQALNTAFIGDKLALSLEDLYPYVVGMTRE